MSESTTNSNYKELKLEKLPSKTYRLSWKNSQNEEKEFFFSTKDQIVKTVNKRYAIKEISEFLKQHLISGTTVN